MGRPGLKFLNIIVPISKAVFVTAGLMIFMNYFCGIVDFGDHSNRYVPAVSNIFCGRDHGGERERIRTWERSW